MSKYILIIILLIIAVYYYNKSKVIEGLENSDQILQKLSSIYNGDTMKVKNIEVTGSASIKKLDVGDSASVKKLNVGDSASVKKLDVRDSASIPTLSTYIIKSNDKDNWIDCKGQLVCYEKLYTRKDMKSEGNIYTKGLEINGMPPGVRTGDWEKKTSYTVRFGTAGITRSEGDRLKDNRNNYGNCKRSCFRQNGETQLRCY